MKEPAKKCLQCGATKQRRKKQSSSWDNDLCYFCSITVKSTSSVNTDIAVKEWRKYNPVDAHWDWVTRKEMLRGKQSRA